MPRAVGEGPRGLGLSMQRTGVRQGMLVFLLVLLRIIDRHRDHNHLITHVLIDRRPYP